MGSGSGTHDLGLAGVEPMTSHDRSRTTDLARPTWRDRPRTTELVRPPSGQGVDQGPEGVDVALLGGPGADAGPDDVAVRQAGVGEVHAAGGVQGLVQPLGRVVAVDVAEAHEVQAGP